jgi:protein O-mannosyl-transferase
MSGNRKIQVLFLAVVALVLLTYANHFQNDFHFDDSHSVVQNPYIRDLRNFPKFFSDIETATVLPANRTWRP